MIQYFNNFTQEQIDMFREVFGNNAEYEENKIILHTDYGDIVFVTKNDSFTNEPEYYIEIEESEETFDDRGDSVYLLEPIWWSKIQDINRVFEDYKNGVEIYAPEYQ